MLPRLVGVVLGHGSIIMVMMVFLLPMEECMSGLVRVAKGGRLPGNGDDLPEGRDHQKNEDEAAAHAGSLAEPFRVLPFALPTQGHREIRLVKRSRLLTPSA